MIKSEIKQKVVNVISIWTKRRFRILWLTTRSVSKRGTNKIAKPIAGADSKGITAAGLDAVFINLITKIELISPIRSEPVSPINIFAGLKL